MDAELEKGMTRITRNGPDGGAARLAVFTICSNNYMPFAKVLMESVHRLHPEAELVVALADERVDWKGLYDGPFRTIEAREVGIPDFGRMAFQYDIMELNTAIKPFVFDFLLDRGHEQVIYFDPDILLHAKLDGLTGRLDDGASLLLTPHLHEPAEVDCDPDDLVIMRAGVYNLGFLAVSRCPETRGIIRWWMRRLRMHCINSQTTGLFVDQKFMDLVPGFAPAAQIVHDRAFNLAYWNLGQAKLERNAHGGWTVDGAPLGFFHFSGFDPRRPGRLSKHCRFFRDNHPPALSALLQDYATRLFAAGYGTIPDALYAYGRFKSGTVIPGLVRQMFRENTPDWPGDPFDSYEAFLHQPAPRGSRDSANLVMTNFMLHLWHQFDNQHYGMDPDRSEDLFNLVRWYVTLARREQHLDYRLIEPVAERLGYRPFVDCAKARQDGTERADVSVIGYLRTTSGVGAVGRHTFASLRESGLRVEGLDVSLGVVSDRSESSVAPWLTETATGRVQLFANVNADQLPLVLADMAPRLANPAYRIAMPAWELEEFPDAWVDAFNGVDEVWALTAWMQRMLVAKLDKPVIRMPVMLTLDPPPALPRSRFGLPDDRFLFYFAFDFLSFIERKNPYGAIAAFRKLRLERSDGPRPALVIKTMNGHHAPEKHAAFMAAVADDEDIVIIDEVLGRNDTLALSCCCDCVLSLHRAEGLGLVVAEAMALGVPVIATDYAATTELLSPETGYPVSYKLIPLQPGEYPMGDNQSWADPDIAHACWLMRQVMRDPAEAARRATAARTHLANHHGREAVLRRQLRRLAELGVP